MTTFSPNYIASFVKGQILSSCSVFLCLKVIIIANIIMIFYSLNVEGNVLRKTRIGKVITLTDTTEV